MTTQWEEAFGSRYLITLENGVRPYFALEKMDDQWENQVFYSKANLWRKRTELFFEGDTIRKVIEEEKQVSTNGEILRQSYREYDTCLQTQERKLLLPLTNRGKPKPLTASTVGNITPFGCTFLLEMEKGRGTTLYAGNFRGNQQLPVGEAEKIADIRNDSDFQEFVKWYMETCPDDYFAKVERVKNSVHQTVKYRTGDIFRVEYDRFSYCYGLITGEVRKIRKWKELPKEHSLRSLMTVPVMVRFYLLITENANMTPEELSGYALGRVKICSDNDLIWGTHPIMGHRTLTAEEIEFPLVCSRMLSDRGKMTLLGQDGLIYDGLLSAPEPDYYVEWGTAQTVLPYGKLSSKLKDWLKSYFCPWGGVQMGIFPDEETCSEEEKAEWISYRNNLQISQNRPMMQELFRCLGLPDTAEFDDFAEAFGGLTMEELVKKLNSN